MIKKASNGFTLIEIIVVIAIIGVLASVGTSMYGEARKQARDAQRIADLKSIAQALHVYEQRYGYYPTEEGHLRRTSFTGSDRNRVGRLGISASPGQPGFEINDILSRFFSRIPGDPLGPDNDLFHYYYDGWAICQSSEVTGPPFSSPPLQVYLFAKNMEIPANANFDEVCDLTDPENSPNSNSYIIIIGKNDFISP